MLLREGAAGANVGRELVASTARGSGRGVAGGNHLSGSDARPGSRSAAWTPVPRGVRQIRMSAVVGGDGRAESRVGTRTAAMILTIWLEAR
jgi:hypothetical protein